MSVLYKKMQRINPRNIGVAKKWHPVPNSIGQKSEKEIAEALAKNTTLNKGEAAMAINELQAVIIDFLLDGYTVQMGDWGSFLLTFNSEGADTEDTCTANNIKSVNIRFRPGSEMKNSLANAAFVER